MLWIVIDYILSPQENRTLFVPYTCKLLIINITYLLHREVILDKYQKLSV